jgi:tetratricopeptide (TPR) repeat protein
MSEQLQASIVRIFSPNGSVWGAGFLVSERHVVTCAHVVAQALGISPEEEAAPTASVPFDFPLLRPEVKFTGSVIFWRPIKSDPAASTETSEDIAVLEFNAPLPSGCRPAQLVSSNDFWNHDFRAFGFPSGHDNGIWADGKLKAAQAGGWIQIEDVGTTGQAVVPGFSGGPVWDEQLKGIAGMVVVADRRAEARVAFIIPIPILAQAWPPLKTTSAAPKPAPKKSAIWNVPYRRNFNFSGRDALLTKVQETLASAPMHVVAITGLGGIGKTQLAVEFAFRFANTYSLVWWVRAEEPAKLAADFAALASELELPEKDEPDERKIIAAVRDWLERSADNWLLVFDNAPDAAAVKNYLPQSSAGQVLLTSRNPTWRKIAVQLDVDVLAREDAVEFLLARTGQEDRRAAAELAEELGDLPLALEQAAAYIETMEKPLADYLRLFRTRQKDLLQWVDDAADYTQSVAATWGLSFQALQKQAPESIELLNLLAFFASEDIPQKLLHEGADCLPPALATLLADEIAFDTTQAALKRYSLLEVDSDQRTYSLHRLVQAVTRDRLAAESARELIATAVRLVERVFPIDSGELPTWTECAQLLPHALAVTRHAEQVEIALEETAFVLSLTSEYLKGRAQFVEAKAAMERAVALAMKVFGPSHSHVAVCLSKLGEILFAQEDFPAAKACFELALNIDETQDPQHPQLAGHLINLGAVQRKLGDLASARAALERVLRLQNVDPRSLSNALNNLGGVLYDERDFAAAQSHYERALALDEQALPPHHPDVAVILNNLGKTLAAQENINSARAYYERALGILQESLGPEHPSTKAVSENLSALLSQ